MRWSLMVCKVFERIGWLALGALLANEYYAQAPIALALIAVGVVLPRTVFKK